MLMRAALPSSVGTSMRAAERRLHHRDRHAAMHVGPFALEQPVAAHRQEDVEIAGRPAARAGLALAAEADARAVLDAGRDVDLERLLAPHAALAGADACTACRSPGPRRGRRGRRARR